MILLSPTATADRRAYYAGRHMPVAADTTIPGRDEVDVCERGTEDAWAHLALRHAPREA